MGDQAMSQLGHSRRFHNAPNESGYRSITDIRRWRFEHQASPSLADTVTADQSGGGVLAKMLSNTDHAKYPLGEAVQRKGRKINSMLEFHGLRTPCFAEIYSGLGSS